MDLSDAHASAYVEYAQIAKLLPKVFNPILMVTDCFYENISELMEMFDTDVDKEFHHHLEVPNKILSGLVALYLKAICIGIRNITI